MSDVRGGDLFRANITSPVVNNRCVSPCHAHWQRLYEWRFSGDVVRTPNSPFQSERTMILSMYARPTQRNAAKQNIELRFKFSVWFAAQRRISITLFWFNLFVVLFCLRGISNAYQWHWFRSYSKYLLQYGRGLSSHQIQIHTNQNERDTSIYVFYNKIVCERVLLLQNIIYNEYAMDVYDLKLCRRGRIALDACTHISTAFKQVEHCTCVHMEHVHRSFVRIWCCNPKLL